MSSFKRASAVLLSNSGCLYEKNYSLVLRINPRLNKHINVITRRNNATSDKPAKPKEPEPKGVSYKNLTIGVPKETFLNERRVAITPAVTQNLTKKGFHVVVEENAGLAAKFPNDQYAAAGAKLADAKKVYSSADILLKVRSPDLNVSLSRALRVNSVNTLVSMNWSSNRSRE